MSSLPALPLFAELQLYTIAKQLYSVKCKVYTIAKQQHSDCTQMKSCSGEKFEREDRINASNSSPIITIITAPIITIIITAIIITTIPIIATIAINTSITES